MVKIYTLKDPITNEIRYVGKTKQSLKARWYSHCSLYRLNRNVSYKNSWIKSLLNHNLKPIIELLDIVPESEWEFWESYWIFQLKSWNINLTNMTSGGEGCNGGKGSLGYKHTEEAKKRISIANSKPRTQEWITNSANANKKPILQFDLKNNLLKRWDSSTDAAIFLGNKNYKKNITACCRGKKKTAYKFIWRYENVESKDKEPLR